MVEGGHNMLALEAVFDISYLALAFYMGFSLALDNKKDAKLFGLLTLILALGDSFHLLPRVISIFTADFLGHYALLSWGKFVTSITMTVFYCLYYLYYCKVTSTQNTKATKIIFSLALLRLVIVFLPQNGWGSNESYIFGIIRNIPFLLMGIYIVYLTYIKKDNPLINKAYLYIALSFFFYLIVVTLTKFYPLLGSFMLPKTLAYLFLIRQNYKLYAKNWQHNSLLNMAFTSLILALIAGAFYREFTKAFAFSGKTTLSLVHTHLFVLGFVLPLLVYILLRLEIISANTLDNFLGFYKLGLNFTILAMFIKGLALVINASYVIDQRVLFMVLAGHGHFMLAYAIFILVKSVNFLPAYKEIR